MDIKPIKSEADYEAALAEIAELMNAEPGTEEGDRLDVLATLVEAYEAKAHPTDAPDPIEAIRGNSGDSLLNYGRLRAGRLMEISILSPKSTGLP